MAKPTYALYIDDQLKERNVDREKLLGDKEKLVAAGEFTGYVRVVKEITISETKRGLVETVKPRKRGETKAKKPPEQKK